MVYNSYDYKNYDQIRPFIKDGIFIDTSIIRIFIDGFINTKFSKKGDLAYKILLDFFQRIKVGNAWNNFFITPHVLSEILGQLNQHHRRDPKYTEIVSEILPILGDMEEERKTTKDQIIGFIDYNKPVVEVGDISIYLAVEGIANIPQKVSILAKDFGFRNRYEEDPNILIMDFESIYNESLSEI